MFHKIWLNIRVREESGNGLITAEEFNEKLQEQNEENNY
jgi:hypothetical protein